MKAYFVLFAGDPSPHLEPLRAIDLDIDVVTIIPDVLHCVTFSTAEQFVLNALQPHSPPAAHLCLMPAHLPIHPVPPREVVERISGMMAAAYEDEFIG